MLMANMGEPKTRAIAHQNVGHMLLTSRQTAEYTRQMLDSLKGIAKRQNQQMLAKLLEIASLEAGRLAEQTEPDVRQEKSVHPDAVQPGRQAQARE